jgi:hypothetical protein
MALMKIEIEIEMELELEMELDEMKVNRTGDRGQACRDTTEEEESHMELKKL